MGTVRAVEHEGSAHVERSCYAVVTLLTGYAVVALLTGSESAGTTQHDVDLHQKAQLLNEKKGT